MSSERITELVIDRKEWYRGHTGKDSKLLTGDGRKCCLGFLSLACGLKNEDIRNTTMPAAISIKLPESMGFLIEDGRNSRFSGDASRINDTLVGDVLGAIFNPLKLLSEEHREQLLTELFAAEGIALTFIN